MGTGVVRVFGAVDLGGVGGDAEEVEGEGDQALAQGRVVAVHVGRDAAEEGEAAGEVKLVVAVFGVGAGDERRAGDDDAGGQKNGEPEVPVEGDASGFVGGHVGSWFSGRRRQAAGFTGGGT